MKKKIIKDILLFTIIPIVMGIVGLLLMAIAFLIPAKYINKNIEKSVDILLEEGDYFSLIPGMPGDKCDNYTDAIYLNEALVSTDDVGLLECILGGYRFIEKEDLTNKSLQEVEILAKSITNKEELSLYPGCRRFFNGYQVILKIMLIVTSYTGIRIINILMVSILFAVLCILMYKKGLTRYILPVLISIIFINPIAISYCMTFVGFYYCMIIPCIIILLMDKEKLEKKGWIFFEIIGACAFYFNMNYFQLLTFGMPLLFYFLITGIPENIKELVKTIAKLFISWFFGYAGLMIFKWITYAILLNPEIFKEMIKAMIVRSSTNRGSRSEGLLINCQVALNNIWWNALEILFILYSFINHIRTSKNKQKLFTRQEIILLLIMIMLPICRYIIFSNHVIIHNWVTYRILMMPILTFNILITKKGETDGLRKI